MFFASTVVVVVSIIRIMLFWLKNYENIILNTYKKLKNWSIVVLLFTKVELMDRLCIFYVAVAFNKI